MAAVNRLRLLTALAVIWSGLSLFACAPTQNSFSDLPKLRVAVRLSLENLCAGSQSPPIALANVPAGTAHYRVRMSNISVLLQTPGEWTIPVPAEPGLVPIGALPGYAGPCPGEFQSFSYRLEVLALDAQGRPAGFGTATLQVASVNKMAQEAWQGARRGGALDPTLPPAFDDDFQNVFSNSPARGRDLNLFYGNPGDRMRDNPRDEPPAQPGQLK